MRWYCFRSLAIMNAFALFLSAESAAGQRKMLKEQLVGSWSFASAYIEGLVSRTNLFDAEAKGMIVFAADGHFAVITTRSPGEIAFAFFGTYTVNEAEKTIIRRYDSSIVPRGQQTEYESSVEFASDQLRLTDQNGATSKTVFIYRRAQ